MGKVSFRKFLEDHGALEHYVRGRLRLPEYHASSRLSPDKPYYWTIFAFHWKVVLAPPGLTWQALGLEWGELVLAGEVDSDPGMPLFDRLGLTLLLSELEDCDEKA